MESNFLDCKMKKAFAKAQDVLIGEISKKFLNFRVLISKISVSILPKFSQGPPQFDKWFNFFPFKFNTAQPVENKKLAIFACNIQHHASTKN